VVMVVDVYLVVDCCVDMDGSGGSQSSENMTNIVMLQGTDIDTLC